MDGKDRSHPGTGVTLPTQPHIHIWISGHLPACHSPFHTHLRHLSSADTTPWEPLRRCSSWALGCPITLHPTACPPPLPASGLLTPRPWQCGAGWAICTHILKFSPSQLLLRQEVMVCRACSDPVHTSIHGEAWVSLLPLPTDHLLVVGKDPISRNIFGRISFSVYPFPELNDRKISAQQNPLMRNGLPSVRKHVQGSQVLEHVQQ